MRPDGNVHGVPVRRARIPPLPVSPYMKEEEPVAMQENTDYHGSGHELFVLIAYAQTYTHTNIFFTQDSWSTHSSFQKELQMILTAELLQTQAVLLPAVWLRHQHGWDR